MVTYERALELTRSALDGLNEGGLLDVRIDVTPDTPLLGGNSQLDSIGLVTFVSDLEERLQRETGRDVFLVLADVHKFNAGASHLTVAALARYIEHVTAQPT